MKKRPDVPSSLPSAEDLAHVDDGQFTNALYDDLERAVKRYYHPRVAAGVLKRSEVIGTIERLKFALQVQWMHDDAEE